MTDLRPRFGAAGIGVTDLARSTAFYCDVFGLTVLTKFRLPDMEEAILSYGHGAAVVLMCHTDGVDRDLSATGGKLVFYVADPAATVDVARNIGAEVVREATPVPEFDDAVIAFVKDPDGQLVEILQAVG